MKFSKLYKEVLIRWPEEVEVSDGEACAASGFFFRNLTETWETVEVSLGYEDPWLQLMGWATYQVFHEEACRLFHKGETVLNTRRVSVVPVKEAFARHLESTEWQDLRAQYVDDVGPFGGEEEVPSST